jgi:hypothetical protein
MSTLRHPVGSQPPEVYWRRRLMVGIGALVVLIVILLIVFAPKGNGTPSAVSSPTSTSTAAAGDAATAAACEPDDLKVVASVNASTFDQGVPPQFGFTITNSSSSPCVVSAGSDQQDFVVSSGQEKYWSSKDCQTAPQHAEVTLEAGGSQGTTVPVEWGRTRSSVETCGQTAEQVPAGGATYKLTVTVAGVESDPVRFILN